jgi:hypothetical protein
MLLRPGADFQMAKELEAGMLTLGAAFSFMSGLYFRGKLTYAQTFGRRPAPAATLIITPTRGLQKPDTPVTAAILREFAAGEVDVNDGRYRAALERDALALSRRLDAGARVVLLGSVATGKYVDILSPLLGDRLCYPASFIGRGDMSRGGLLLRSAAAGTELEYVAIQAGVRPRGRRPPKLGPRP